MKEGFLMEISVLLAEQILKLFLILLLGFLLVKTGKLKASDSKCISVILVYLILPCVIYTTGTKWIVVYTDSFCRCTYCLHSDCSNHSKAAEAECD